MDIFPPLYEDELFYSWISRYHSISGNSYRITSKQLFNKSSLKPNLLYPVNLDYFCLNFSDYISISSDYIIKKHTIIPLFKPFLTELEYNEMIKLVKSEGTQKENYGKKRSFKFYGEYNNREINYCPLCLINCFEGHREYFINKEHQVPGNKVCNKHLVMLRNIKIPLNVSAYKHIDINNLETIDLNYSELAVNEEFINFSLDINKLFNSSLDEFNLKLTNEKYNVVFQKKAYKSKEGPVNRRRLIKDFFEFYSSDFLNEINTIINNNNSFEWLEYIGSERFKFIHPVRHILFIRFLFGSFNDFINFDYIEEQLKLNVLLTEIKTEMNFKGRNAIPMVLKMAYKSGVLENFLLYFKKQSLNNGIIDNYKKLINDYIKKNNISKKTLKNLFDIEYTIIEIFDKEWIDNLKLINRNEIKKTINKKYNINWNEKDKFLSGQIYNIINEIRNEIPLQRVTYSYIAKKIGYHGLRERKKLELLPITKKIIDDNIESINSFRKRKILYIIKQLKDEGEDVTISKVANRVYISDNYKELRDFIVKAIEDINK